MRIYPKAGADDPSKARSTNSRRHLVVMQLPTFAASIGTFDLDHLHRDDDRSNHDGAMKPSKICYCGAAMFL